MKRLRREQGLTQEAAANKVQGFYLRHWQFLEKGEKNFTARTLVRIAKALSVDPQDLLLS